MRLWALVFTVFMFLLHPAYAFSDIAQSRYPEALLYLKDHHVLAGYPDGTFRPQQTLTRAELVSLLLKAPGEGAGCFADVDPSAWYAGAVCAARARGWISGYSDNTFRPQQPVAYAEALKMVLNAYGLELAHQGERWYEPYQHLAHERGFLSSYSYFPEAAISREVLAQLLYRVLQGSQGQPLGFQSAGCGQPVSAVPPDSLEVNGITRDMIVSLPESYDPARAYPLVVAFHGRTNSNQQVRKYFRLEASLEAIFVYPAGLQDNSGYSWSDSGDSSNALRDYAFFDRIMQAMQNLYCIDTDRIFVVGHSLGAWFANSLACARGDVIRAVASVAGGISTSECRGPVAAMLLHHPEDHLVPLAEGLEARDTFLSQERFSEAQSTGGEVLQRFSCQRYAAPLHPVVWCPHSFSADYGGDYYPHLWPAATAEAIAYFFNHLPSFSRSASH